MQFKQFEDTFLYILEQIAMQKEYISNVPSDASTFIVCNKYSESYYNIYERLLKELFGEHIADKIHWFIFEVYQQNKSLSVYVDKKQYKISNEKSFLEFIKIEYYN